MIKNRGAKNILNVTCKYKPICKFSKYGTLCNKRGCEYYSKGELKLNPDFKGYKQ